ncbi:MAG: MFS transporter [Rikenellaceae bacterium]|nr:MFS transporter [Rikenellaceae bacterium]
MGKINSFPRTFWVANGIELFERWAWYGFFMLFANYLTGSSDLGGLEFTQSQKGLIMGVGTGILYFLPVLTGAIADRYGYKKVLFISFLVYATAFVLLPHFKSFPAVFAMYLYLAVGAALFKPVISATIAKTTHEGNASIGFGIFYMMVNIGAFFGPVVTLLFKDNYQSVFYISAGIVLINLLLLFLYKEPGRDQQEAVQESLGATFGKIFRNMGSIFKDWKFILFLLIAAGFWTMYNQLFYMLPVFITQWVDTSVLYDFFARTIPFISQHYSPAPGVLDSEFVVNFDAMYIILFQILVSSIVMRMRPLRSMVTGFLVCTIGMALTLASQNVLFTLAAILIFALGEMAGSPKITEYIGSIAPADKKALYMGYSFIPVFLGNVAAGFISGNVYQAMADKVTLVRDYVARQGLSIPDGLSQNEYFSTVASQMGLSDRQLTDTLWELYSPSGMWIVIAAIGLTATVLLFLYDRLLNKQTV